MATVTTTAENSPESSDGEPDVVHDSLHHSSSIPSFHDLQTATEGRKLSEPVNQTEPSHSFDHLQTLLEGGKSQNPDEPVFSLYDRFGWFATTTLIVTTLLTLAAMGFLWFLWAADQRNKTWHSMAARNWITRAVTLTSVAIRTSISLQATIGTSLLAGLALENTQVLMLNLASVSMMRNANAGPNMLLWLMFKAFSKDTERWRRSLLPMMVLLLATVSLLTEFTSTVLLSDLKQTTLPGHTVSSTTATNFVYDTNGTIPFLSRGTVWTKKPPFYPTFAEYHEDSTDNPADTVDTGPTLRGFLPIESQQQRSMLRDFSGRATMIDSRVRCIRPQLALEKGHYAAEPVLGLSGQVTTATGETSDFSCVLPFSVPPQDGTVSNEWQIGMSYLGQFPNSSFAPLQSELRQITSNSSYGMVFLVVNVTAGSPNEWRQVLGTDGGEYGTFGGTGAQPKAYRGHGEWADLLFTTNESTVMSASLCYASYDSAVLNITALGGDTNRTEPFPIYDVHSQSYDYTMVRRQLGQIPFGAQSLTAEDRGVFSISKRDSWLPGPGDYARSSWLSEPVTLDFDDDPADTFEYVTATSVSHNITAYIYNAPSTPNVWEGQLRLNPDPSVTALFQQILQGNGNIAFALQSILTIFAGMTYYDQLQRFNSPNKIRTTPIILVNRPRSVRGIVAVTTVLGIHFIVMSVILHLFLSRAVLSTLGNAWQTLAQIVRGDVLKLIKTAALATDKTVEDKMKQERWKNRLVGVRLCRHPESVELVYRDSPSGLGKMMKNAPYRRRRLIGRKQSHRVGLPKSAH
ncbi:MAG: hypothetical protein LQ338_003525 [Usnochroma carphineum]|nr:MAG: hypothetical protein LQ338_003525 [Usnochroma carphineum]